MSKNFVTNFRGDNLFTPSEKFTIKNEPLTPEEYLDMHYVNFFENRPLKKSLSTSDIASLKEDLIKLGFQDDSQNVYEKCKGTDDAPKKKFVSMAEAIYHYQKDTPGRFRSKKPQMFKPQTTTGRLGLTVPHSPMLRSKTRSRPVHILSKDEREEKELEEIKKFKIKANPIPKSVLTGATHLPEITKKPVTVPEPFKLTEVIKKPVQSPQQQQTFKARPAPKHILEKPQVVPYKPPVQVTNPVSPKFHYKRSHSADNFERKCSVNNMKLKPNVKIEAPPQKNIDKPEQKAVQRQGPIKPEPFSFEKRDEEIKRRREERIKQQIEEERKQASHFKAQPLPGAVKKRMVCVSAKGSSSSTSSENKENHIKFEAKPPTVLYKEPFKPVLRTLPVVKPVPFHLTTEKRAAEREKFEQLLKEKEEEQERLKLQREKEMKEAEEKERAELRAKLIHYAKPIPDLTPFIPEKSEIPITVPETPKFLRRLKNQN